MLGFFRRYQRYFFLVITVVIVISFSFFGTYNTIPAENIHEQVAFTAVDGTQVSRSDLEEMTLFIGTDSEDKIISGGFWGPNFLNDGVIKKDILQTGLAEILVKQFEPAVAADLQKKLEKEKRFKLYSHPEAAFINIESVWEYFAPDMKTNFMTLKKADKATAEDAMTARVRLFLGERRLPPPMLRQVLRYQEKQAGWVASDPNLDRTDLSLFGYHTLNDWFGPNFLRLVAEFIINAGKVAEQKGYVVTKEEALADLIRNAQVSYQQNIQSPSLGVANSKEYFQEQLRRMNMDQSMAIKVWRQVLLFRRLFQDIGQSVLIDPFSFEQVNTYAKESAYGEMYHLPKALQLNDYASLQKFEAYLAAVSRRPEEESKQLSLPTVFQLPAEVAKKAPGLVEKRYVLEISQADKKNLQASVGVKESWEWQTDEKNWTALKKEFPELATKKGASPEERFSTLESLDNRTRSRVDAFTRTAILDARPDIIANTLAEAKPKRQTVSLTLKGSTPPFQGIKDPKKLMDLLDKAPLAGEESSVSEAALKAQEQLDMYSGDGEHYYRVRVIERKPDLEILTFAEANARGALDSLVDSQLESFYQQNREKTPAAYQKADKSWKPLSEVRTAIADEYYAKVLKAIRQDYANSVPKDKKQELTTGDNAAPYRLYAYVRDARKTLEKSPEKKADYVRQPKEETAGLTLEAKEPLSAQWKLEKREYEVERSKDERKLNPEEVFAMVQGSWTAVQTSPNGDLYFFQKTANKGNEASALIADKINQARRLLSDDVQRAYMKNLVAEIKTKNAISLDYMDADGEMEGDAQEG